LKEIVIMDMNRIIALLKKHENGLRTEEILSLLKVRRREHHLVRGMLAGLRKQGLLRQAGGRYLLSSSRGLVRGRFVTGRRGFGFVCPPDGGQDVFIPARYAEGVMNGDEVEAIVREAGKFGKPEGRIIRVVRQARSFLIGIYIERGGSPFIQAFDTPGAEAIPLKAFPGRSVKTGMLIEADRKSMTVSAVFGHPDESGVDTEVTVRRFGLHREFPAETLEEAKAFPGSISRKTLSDRTDFRNWTTYTIDGEKARDFDDAVSIRRLKGGNFLLGVHIADVSEYVREGSWLDQEARLRGTSVYFPDLTLPMLPERLSNGLCSLKPGVNRLAVSVLMEIDARGRVLKSDFHLSVIKTAARLTYTSVYAILSGDERERARYESLIPSLEMMKKAADALRGQRLREGSLDFDLVEPELVYEEGKLKSVIAAERNEAHLLIEEFMVAANVAVASYLSRAGIPSIYRVHPAPAPADLEKLRLLLGQFGYFLPDGRTISPFDLQTVLSRARGRAEEKFITVQVLRAMKLASYEAANVGHFGLAKTEYTHFTSPIRRYPDLIVHRILKAALAGGRGPEDGLETLAAHCSDRERNADAAEQYLLEWRIFRLLQKRLGDDFDGIVVDVNKTGLVVELEGYFVEGLLPFDVLDGLPVRDKRKGRAKAGPRKRYALGDEVRVTLAAIDPVFQKMSFVPAEQG